MTEEEFDLFMYRIRRATDGMQDNIKETQKVIDKIKDAQTELLSLLNGYLNRYNIYDKEGQHCHEAN
jgi:hypothetical protein